MNFLNQHHNAITQLCFSNKVKTLFAFGSVVTNNFTAERDIDLIVDMDEMDSFSYSDKYFNLIFQLETLLNRNIDLLEEKALRNQALKQQIDHTKVTIYGGGN